MPDAPHTVLPGQRVSLAMARPDRMPLYYQWEINPATIAGFGARWPVTWEVFVARSRSAHDSEYYHLFEVVTAEDGEPVGTTALNVNRDVNTAELTVLIAPDHRGRGYGTEATALTAQWAFTISSLSALWLQVIAGNTAAVRTYSQAGFREAGRLRNAALWHGERVDQLYMDCLPTDLTDTERR
jgi:diamine N-acetyltransferase